MKGHYSGDGRAGQGGLGCRRRILTPGRTCPAGWAVGAGRWPQGGGRRAQGGGRRAVGAGRRAVGAGRWAQGGMARRPMGRLTYARSGCQTVFWVRNHFLGARSAPGGQISHQESLLTPRFLAPSTTVAPALSPGVEGRLADQVRTDRLPPPPEDRRARAAAIGRRRSPVRRRWDRSPKTTRPVPRRCACGSSRPDRDPRCRTPGCGSCLAPARPGRS
jgi:hypothetical protein